MNIKECEDIEKREMEKHKIKLDIYYKKCKRLCELSNKIMYFFGAIFIYLIYTDYNIGFQSCIIVCLTSIILTKILHYLKTRRAKYIFFA